MYLQALMTADVDNQLELATRTITAMMRALGLTLPGKQDVPTTAHVRDRLDMLTQEALDSIEEAKQSNPRAASITGEASDDSLKVLAIVEQDKLVVEAWVRVN